MYERKSGETQPFCRIWVRLLGICERKSRKLALAWVPEKIVDLAAKPPPESKVEVDQSGLLQKVNRPAAIYSDGAHAWPAALRGTPLPHGAARHNRHEYTRKVEMPRGFSKLAGTQCLDKRWGVLCSEFLPKQLHAKVKNSEGVSIVNPLLRHGAMLLVDFPWQSREGSALKTVQNSPRTEARP